MPYGVWTIPEVATVGMSEHDARAHDLSYEIGRRTSATTCAARSSVKRRAS